MASTAEKEKQEETEVPKKKVHVPRTASEQQRYKLAKLLKNPEKPVFIPEKREERLPRVFNPPEFIRNIWGSSAGVGSGDFHVYRGMRRREYARQKFLDEKEKKDILDEEFQKRLVEHKAEAVAKTEKKRAKRIWNLTSYNKSNQLKKKAKQKNKKALGANKQKNNNDNKEDDDSEEEEQVVENMEQEQDSS